MIDTTLAHYSITAALGAGGMGEVWRATDEKLGREVAVPVLSLDPPTFDSPTALFDARLEDAADRQYDVFPGGQKFVLNRRKVEDLEPIVVVLGWAEMLEKEAR